MFSFFNSFKHLEFKFVSFGVHNMNVVKHNTVNKRGLYV